MSESFNNTADNYDVYSHCKPFLKWVGGKSQLLPELTKRLPKTFNRYFEPFLGGGALYFKLQPTAAFLSDINADLIGAYQVVKSDTENLIRDLQQHRYEESYYYNLRNIDRLPTFSSYSPIQKASRLIYLNKTGFNGLYRVNSKGLYNVPFGRYSKPNFCDSENLRACSRALNSANIQAASFTEILSMIQPNDFVYFDPPYVPLTASAKFTNYSKEGFDLQLQRDLRDLCQKLDKMGVNFMLSNSSASLVLEMYQGFNIERISANRMVNSKANKRGPIDELIIRNYSYIFEN